MKPWIKVLIVGALITAGGVVSVLGYLNKETTTALVGAIVSALGLGSYLPQPQK